jgi:hypothetical protein
MHAFTTLFVGAILVDAAVGLGLFVHTVTAGRVRSDQAQTVIDAGRLWRRGTNPYGSQTVTDEQGYLFAMRELDARSACRASNAPVAFRVGVANPSVVPRIDDTRECSDVRRLFASLGFKYGPLILIFYAPFVALFGPAGFVVAHVLLIAALVLVVRRWLREDGGMEPVITGGLVMVVASTHLARNTLVQEHLDLLPLLLALMGWHASMRDRHAMAGVWVGLSVAAKALPGALYLPLLIGRTRWRGLAAFAAVSAAWIAPFAASDWIGLRFNLGYPFARPADSTAAIFFLSARAGAALRAAAVCVIVVFAVRGFRARWTVSPAVEYLVASHLAVLAAGTTLHNNYLVWLLPLVAYYVVIEWDRTAVARTVSTASL